MQDSIKNEFGVTMTVVSLKQGKNIWIPQTQLAALTGQPSGVIQSLVANAVQRY